MKIYALFLFCFLTVFALGANRDIVDSTDINFAETGADLEALFVADAIDFGDISDTSAIDADTEFTAPDGISLTLTPSHTSGDWNFLVINANQVDDAAATDDFDAVRLDLTSESGDAGDTFDGLVIIWENGTANTIMDNAIKIDNAETTASTMTNAIVVTSSGVDGGVVDAIDVSDSNITNALNIGANDIVFSTGTLVASDLEVIDDGSIVTGEITDGTILEADLDEDSGTPTDGDILTYDSTGGNFNWIAVSSAGGDGAISAAGVMTVDDDEHNHTTTTISGVDISDDTNLAAGTGATLTGDSISVDLGTAIDTSEITDATIDQVDIDDTDTLAGNPTHSTNSVWFATTGLIAEGSTADTNETLVTFADPGSDITITVPATTGTLVTTGDTGTVDATMMAANSVDSSELVDGSVDLSHMSVNSIDSDQYVDGSIDTAHYASASIDATAMGADSVGESELIEAMNFTATGDWNFGGATNFEIPNGATPTAPNLAGEMVIDTNIMAATHGGIVIHDGTQTLNMVGTTDTPADNEIPKYDSGTGKITWEADAGGGSGAFSDAGDPIVQNTTTKDVHVGDGAGTLAGKLEIGGDADQPQLVVEGHSTQTDSLIVGQNDADTEVFNVDVDGTVLSAVGYDVIGNVDMDMGSADVDDFTVITDGGTWIFDDTITIPVADTPTTAVDGELAVDTDGWGTNFDAIEFYNGTASAYVVATTASDSPTNGQVPQWNTGGEITWETVAGSGDVTAAASITDNALVRGDGGSKGIQESNINIPDLSDTASQSIMDLRGTNRATPADNDEIYISFQLEDDAALNQEFGQVVGIAEDVSNTTEDGTIALEVVSGGTLFEGLRVTSSAAGNREVVVNDGSIDVDFRVESDGRAVMFNVIGSADEVTVGGNTAKGASLTVDGWADQEQFIVEGHSTQTNDNLVVQNSAGTTLASVDNTGTLTLVEQASAPGDTATYGQIWVKNDTPNTLWFTNDAGTDAQLGTSGATTYDSIGDPTGVGLITFDDTETATYDSAEDGGTFFTISLNDSALAADTEALLITAVANDDAQYIPLLIQDDQDGTPDDLAKIDSTGVLTLATGITVGAAALTEAELEILDGATITTAETETLSDGSNADSLHVHASAGVSGLVDADMSNDALDADKIVGDSTDDDDLDVAAGGTGVSTFTANGALYGNTTSDIQVTAAHTTNGSLLIGDGSGVPTVATLTATANETTITNGAGSITIGLPDDVTLTGDLTVNGDDIIGDADLNLLPTGDDVNIGTSVSTEPQKLHIFDGATDNEPGGLILYDDAGADYALFVDTAGNLRFHTAYPTDDDTDGTALGSGGATAWDDIGDADAAATIDFDTHTQTIDIGVTDTGGPKGGLILDWTGNGVSTTDVHVLEITTGANGDANYIPIAVFDDDAGANDLQFQVDSLGVVTANGVTLGANENITLGSNTLDHDGTTFVFNDDVTVSDEVYDATNWDGSTEVPTKNAVRDKLEGWNTGSILLLPEDALLPTANYPDLDRHASTGGVEDPEVWVLKFSSTAEEDVHWKFQVPHDFDASVAPHLFIYWMTANAIGATENPEWDVAVTSITPGVDDFDTVAPATVNEDNTVGNTTAGIVTKADVTLTNDDDLQPDDICVINLERDGDDASDDMEGEEAIFIMAVFEYTRTDS